MRNAAFAALIAATLVAVAGCDDSHSSSSSSGSITKAVYNQITPGQVGTISKDGDGAPCFDTVENMNKERHAAEVNDDDELVQLNAGGHVVTLHTGERVRVIDFRSHGIGIIDGVRFRILTGDDSGESCYVWGDNTNMLKDVRDHP